MAVEDLAHEVFERAAADDAAGLRRADPATPLLAWLRETRRLLVLEGLRAQRPLQGRDPDAWEAGTGTGEGPIATERGPYGEPTPRQAEALALHREGHSTASVARTLGVSWTAARDLLGRAARRVVGRTDRDARRAREEDGERRLWAVEALKGGFPLGEEQRDLLRDYVTGVSRPALARRRGLSEAAFHMRLSRLRRRFVAWRTPPDDRRG